EDGIRDFHVTGLQTCALPIFAARRGSAPAAPTLPLLPGEALLALRDDPLGFLCGAVRARGDLVALGWGRPPLLLLVHPEHAHHEIGRASCRERAHAYACTRA